MTTTLTSWSVGQRIKASLLNKMVTAIQELQSAVGSAAASPTITGQNSFSAAPATTGTTPQFYKRSGLIIGYFRLQYTGSTAISAPSGDGNLTNVVVCNIPSAWRPPAVVSAGTPWQSIFAHNYSGTDMDLAMEISSGGDVTLYACSSPSGTIAANSNIDVNVIYPAAS